MRRPYNIYCMKLIVENLGFVDYESAWKLQDTYAAEIAAGTRPPTLLLLEHPHVYTFGRRGQAENLYDHIPAVIAQGTVRRCGDVLYHGLPGDLHRHLFIPRRLGDPTHRHLPELAPRHGIRYCRGHGLFNDCHHVYPSSDHIKDQRGGSQGCLGGCRLNT